ncbi:hypothetical protein MASR2M117_01750 [Paludibacter sp.]
MWNEDTQKWFGVSKIEHIWVEGFGPLSMIAYSWDDVTSSWSEYYKTIYEVKEKNGALELEVTTWSFDEVKQSIEKLFKSVYSGLKLANENLNYNFESILNYYWDGRNNQWLLINKEINTFDNANNILLSSDSIWRSDLNKWMISGKAEFVYNAHNFITEFIETSWMFDGIKNELNYKSRELYTYNDEDEMISHIVQNWDIKYTLWLNVSKVIQEYNADGSISIYSNYEWSDEISDWQLISEFENKYDAKGRQTVYSDKYWESSIEKLIIEYRNEMEYDDSDRLIMESYIYNNVDWNDDNYTITLLGNKTVYTYNQSGFLTGKTDFMMENEKFVPQEKYEFTYDDNHPDAIVSAIIYHWNPTTEEWDKTTKQILNYQFDVTKDELLLPFDEDDLEEEALYFNYKLNSALVYKWSDTSNDWVEDSKIEAYYTRKEYSSTEKNFSNQLKVYPNPVSDFIHIDVNDNMTDALFTLYDLQGKVLLQETVTSSSLIDVSRFSNGIYYYQLHTGKDNLNGKIIKK